MNVVVRCLTIACEACICNLCLESALADIAANGSIRSLIDIRNRIAAYQSRRRRRGIRAELCRAARVDCGAVLRTVDARLVSCTQREVTRRDGKAAVLIGDVVVGRIARAEYGICNLRLESRRARIRRDGRTRVDRLRDRRDRVTVDEVTLLNAEQIRTVHIVCGAVCRTVDAALVACGKR